MKGGRKVHSMLDSTRNEVFRDRHIKGPRWGRRWSETVVPPDEAERDGHQGTEFPDWVGKTLSLARRGFWSLSQCTHGILSETRSLVPRILFRLKKNLDSCGVDLGTSHQTHPSGHPVPSTRTRARIHDTQCMLSNHPWATLVDLEIFLEGWEKGARWADPETHKRDSCS